jgi:hypothetical protein
MTIRIVIALALALSAGSTHAQTAPETRPGVAVDARGQPVVDPTKNVLDLVEAAIRRQDDLRGAAQMQTRIQLDAAEKINDLRYRQTQELATALATKLADEAKLRSDFTERLAVAEAKRIDAIRAVDVNAAAAIAQRTTEQATTLQTQTTQQAEVLRNQVARSAEDLRALVATTAATALQNQQQQFNALSARITQLEQAGAEGKGRQAPPDPVIASLLQEVRALRDTRSNVTGIDAGRGDVIGWVVAALMFLVAAGGLFLNFRKSAP